MKQQLTILIHQSYKTEKLIHYLVVDMHIKISLHIEII